MNRAITAILGALLCQSLSAVEAPKIVAGDYLLVYARVVDCGSQLRAIDAGEVDDNGLVTLLGDVTLSTRDRPVYKVRDELVNLMEKRTGHRSESLELHHVPGNDLEAKVKRLTKFVMELDIPCDSGAPLPEILEPSSDWSETYERFAATSGRRKTWRICTPFTRTPTGVWDLQYPTPCPSPRCPGP